MTTEQINPGYEYIYAMLHSWWSKSAHDDVLDELARCTTIGNLLHHLKQFDIIDVKDEDNALGEFVLRQYNKFEKMRRFCPDDVGGFLKSAQDCMKNDNIKLLINYRFSPERVGNVSSELVHFPEFPYLDTQVHAMLSAPTLDQFVSLLEKYNALPGLRKIVERLDKDHDLPAVESAIDALSYASILKTAKCLPLSMRTFILDYLTCLIDSVNLATLLRNAGFYHMDVRQLDESWLDGGRYITRSMWEKNAHPDRKIEAILADLPKKMRLVITGEDGEVQLNKVEYRFECYFYRIAKKCFYQAENCQLAVASYPVLLRYETVNLRRIYEGIRFSLPVREISEMLIR